MRDKVLVDKNRIVERGRGCYNCRAYEVGAAFHQHYQSVRPKIIHEMYRKGITLAGAKTVIENTDQRAVEGRFGLCLVIGVNGDFTTFDNLCDRWSGVVGSSLATSGKPLDKLGDELVDIAEGKASAGDGKLIPVDASMIPGGGPDGRAEGIREEPSSGGEDEE